jgi:hypothetical protein
VQVQKVLPVAANEYRHAVIVDTSGAIHKAVSMNRMTSAAQIVRIAARRPRPSREAGTAIEATVENAQVHMTVESTLGLDSLERELVGVELVVMFSKKALHLLASAKQDERALDEG